MIYFTGISWISISCRQDWGKQKRAVRQECELNIAVSQWMISEHTGNYRTAARPARRRRTRPVRSRTPADDTAGSDGARRLA
jgi:hypothetical protein